MKLENFNNLNKNLNFSFYDINYAEKNDKFSANKYIHEKYNSKRLTIILSNITKKIGAHILNISRQDYEPIASSVNFLITESPVSQQIVDRSCNLGHLDKSHIAVHTYPEYSKKTNIATFRVDINVSTCGLISPIQCINYLLKEFSTETCADIVQIDYFVRGFTRTTNDKKIFIDHQPKPISHYINNRFKKNNYIFEDIFPKLNIWTVKLVVKKIKLNRYFFNNFDKKISSLKKRKISNTIIKEINEIANIGGELKISTK